jgi:hypothetical protein
LPFSYNKRIYISTLEANSLIPAILNDECFDLIVDECIHILKNCE